MLTRIQLQRMFDMIGNMAFGSVKMLGLYGKIVGEGHNNIEELDSSFT